MRVQATMTLRHPPLPDLNCLLSTLGENECVAQVAFQCLSKSVADPWIKWLRKGAVMRLLIGVAGAGELEIASTVARCVKRESHQEFSFGFKNLSSSQRATLARQIEALKNAAPEAAAAPPTEPETPQPSSAKPQRMRIGELLVQLCNLKPEEVEGSVTAAKHFGERLGRYLLRCGLVTPEQLCRAVALQSGLPIVDTPEIKAAGSLTTLFPFLVLKENSCAPFAETAKTVSMAVAEPLKASALRQLEGICRKRVEMFVAPEDVVAKQLDVIYEGSKPRKYTRYQVQMPIEYRFSTRLGRPLDDNAYAAFTANISQGGMALNQAEPVPDIIAAQPRHDIYARAVLKDPLADIHAICQLLWIRQPGAGPAIWRLGFQIVQIAASDDRQLQSLCMKVSRSRNFDFASRSALSLRPVGPSAGAPVARTASSMRTEVSMGSVDRIDAERIRSQLRTLGITEDVLVHEQSYQQFMLEKGIKTLGKGGEGAVYFLRGHVVKVVAPEGAGAALREIAHMLYLNGLGADGVMGERKRRDFPSLLWIYTLSNGSLAVGMQPFDPAESPLSTTLYERLRRGPPLSHGHALALLGALARTLSFMHAMGMIHHDLKPANIFVPADMKQEPIVFDFGQSLLRMNSWGREWLQHDHNSRLWFNGTYRYMHLLRRTAHLGAVAVLSGRTLTDKQTTAMDRYLPSLYDDVFAYARIVRDVVRSKNVQLEKAEAAALIELYRDLMGLQREAKKAPSSGLTSMFLRRVEVAPVKVGPETKWPSMEKVSTRVQNVLKSLRTATKTK